MTDEKKYTGWKRTYIGLLNAATVICIILGCIIHIGGWIGSDIYRSIFGFGSGSLGAKTEMAKAEGSDTDTGVFDTVEGEIAYGNLVLQYGEEYGISYKNYPKDEVPTWKINSKNLKISQKTKKSNWKLGDFRERYKGAEIIVTIPKDMSPDLDLKMNMGAFEAEEGMTFGDISLDADMGSIDLKECTMSELNLNADMGSITIENATFHDGKINADMGSITLDNVTFSKAELSASMGSITVSGSFDELEAKCDMGGMEVESKNDNAELDLKTEMGGISYNGQDVGRSYKTN